MSLANDPQLSAGPRTRARPGRPTREVWDAALGLTWEITEHEPPGHLADRCTHCLIFDSRQLVRRVCGQGADWHRQTDAELLALVQASR